MKKKVLMIAAAVWVAVLTAFTFGCSNAGSNENSLKGKIHLLKNESVALKIKIVPYEGGQRYVTAKFFDLDGMFVGRFEREYNGGDILITMGDINVGGRHVVFPQKMVYGENNSTVIPLTEYYAKEGYPKIYVSRNIDTVLRHEIGKLYSVYSKGDIKFVEEQYGEVSSDSIVLKNPQDRVLYEFKVRAKRAEK